MERCLFGSRNTVKVEVEVQKHRKIVLIGSFKEVSNTLHILSSIFGDRLIGSIADAELINAIKTVEKLKALQAESKARRRLCGN